MLQPKSVSESILRPRQVKQQRRHGVSFYGSSRRWSSSSRSETPSNGFQDPPFRETNGFKDHPNRFQDCLNRFQDHTNQFLDDPNQFHDCPNRFQEPSNRFQDLPNRFLSGRPHSDLFYNNSSASTASSSLSEYLRRRPRSEMVLEAVSKIHERMMRANGPREDPFPGYSYPPYLIRDH